MTKKILSLICVIVILFQLPTFAYEIQTDTEADFKVNTVFALGILESDYYNNNHLEEPVKRSDFAVILYNMLQFRNRTVPAATKQLFNDVDRYHYLAGYLEYLAGLGIISGNENAMFLPEENLSLVQLCKMVEIAGGYREYLAAKGNGNYAYMMLASQLDLLDGVSLSENDSLTRYQLAEILYNLMYADAMVEQSYSNGSTEYKEKENFMSQKMKLFCTEGILTATSKMSLSDRFTSERTIAINDQICAISFTEDVSKYVGWNVRAYYIDDNIKGKTVFAVLPYNNKTLKLTSEDSYTYENGVYQYYREDKQTTAKLKPSKDIVYNERAKFEEIDFVPAYGDVCLIDNNDDNIYDVVLINEYESFAVEAVNAADKIIRLKNKTVDGKNLLINLEEYDEYSICDVLGKQIDIESLPVNSVITLQKCGSKFIKITYTDQTVSGMIDYITSDEDKKAAIGDTEYTVCDTAFFDGWDGKTLCTITAYLDKNNHIAYAVASDENWKIGYLIDCKNTNALENTICMKILTEDGTVEQINCTTDIQLDGVKNQSGTAITNQFTQPQLIRYRLKQEEISAVDSATAKSLWDLSRDFNQTNSDTLYKCVDAKLNYRVGLKAFKRSNVADGLDGEVFAANDDIPVFAVPASNEDAADDDYTVIKLANIPTDQWYDVIGYKYDSTSLPCDAVVIKLSGEDARAITIDSRMMMIRKITQGIKDETDTYMVYGLQGGKSVSYPLKNMDLLQKYGAALQKGDIIRFTPVNESIADYELLYSTNLNGILNANPRYISANETGFSAQFRFIVGRIVTINNGIMIFESSDNHVKELYKISGIKVCLSDKNGDRDNDVRLTDYTQIKTADEYGESADTILINTRSTTLRDVYAIRK